MPALTIKPRPVREPAVIPTAIAEANRVIAEANAYGPGFYKCMPWQERSTVMQERLEAAITAFQNWRKRQGEPLTVADPWEQPCPEPQILLIYLHKISFNCGKWRQWNFAALRTYFYYHRRPDLFRLVGQRHG